MENFYINHLAVFVCAVLSLVVGGLWYSPLLFFKSWQAAAGLTDEQLKKSNPVKNYSLSFLLAYVISYNLAFFLGDKATNWQWGLTAGLLAGAGWSASAFIMIGLFELRPLKYLLINSGYIVVYFALVGFILGLWR